MLKCEGKQTNLMPVLKNVTEEYNDGFKTFYHHEAHQARKDKTPRCWSKALFILLFKYEFHPSCGTGESSVGFVKIFW